MTSATCRADTVACSATLDTLARLLGRERVALGERITMPALPGHLHLARLREYAGRFGVFANLDGRSGQPLDAIGLAQYLYRLSGGEALRLVEGLIEEERSAQSGNGGQTGGAATNPARLSPPPPSGLNVPAATQQTAQQLALASALAQRGPVVDLALLTAIASRPNTSPTERRRLDAVARSIDNASRARLSWTFGAQAGGRPTASPSIIDLPRALRAIVAAPLGWSLVVADVDSADLRGLAPACGDPVLTYCAQQRDGWEALGQSARLWLPNYSERGRAAAKRLASKGSGVNTWRVMKEAMGHEVAWHDLRHLFAVRCLSANVPIATVSRWMGHSDVNLTVKRYGRFAAESHEQFRAMGRVGASTGKALRR